MDNTGKILRSFTPYSFEVDESGKGKTITGYALLFGVRSRLLREGMEKYYEVLEPGSVTKEMLDKQDIKLTMFHDRKMILARSKKGVGTLKYNVDKKGVQFSFEIPDTTHGKEALELVKRGDIDGCSFMYSTNEEDSKNCVSYETVHEVGEDYVLRHVKRIERVYDFTLTPDPAYEQTTVTARDMEGTKAEKIMRLRAAAAASYRSASMSLVMPQNPNPEKRTLVDLESYLIRI